MKKLLTSSAMLVVLTTVACADKFPSALIGSWCKINPTPFEGSLEVSETKVKEGFFNISCDLVSLYENSNNGYTVQLICPSYLPSGESYIVTAHPRLFKEGTMVSLSPIEGNGNHAILMKCEPRPTS